MTNKSVFFNAKKPVRDKPKKLMEDFEFSSSNLVISRFDLNDF